MAAANFLDKFQASALRVVREKLNSFFFAPESSRARCMPFYVDNFRVGSIREEFVAPILEYPKVFECVEDTAGKKVRLVSNLNSYAARTEAVNGVLRDLKQRGLFSCLRGWRNENYNVHIGDREEKLFAMERAGCGLFGVIQYGAHVNGYVRGNDGSLRMWLGRRSPTKQTYPNQIDNMVAGGISDADASVRDCTIRECTEEAGVPLDYAAANLRAVGAIFYCFEDDRGVLPEVEYVYDLEVPADFVPQNTDGEMQSFQLYSMDEVKELIARDDFKPNCAGVVIDFLIRHGVVTADNCGKYTELLRLLHHRIPDYD